ncbi:MAG: YihY/virulence factor BrkB family protein [Siphonobacter sp.]
MPQFDTVEQLQAWLRKIQIRRTGGSLYHLLRVLLTNILQFDIDQRATAVAYSFTLALFPTIIVLFTLIPYIPITNLDDIILRFFSEIMPNGLYREAEPTIRDIVSQKRGGILSLGFAFAIFSAMNGMIALMRAFNVTQRAPEERSFLKTRLVALMLTGLLAMVLFVAVGVLIVGRIAMEELAKSRVINIDSTYQYIQILSYFTVFTLLFVAVSIIYYFAPVLHKRWHFINAGSIITSILIIIITQGFSYYFSNFSSYNRVYGAVGTLIALMVWLYLVALLLILGFEINQSLDDASRQLARERIKHRK